MVRWDAFGIAALRGRLNFETIKGSLLETIRTTGMIFTILIGAIALNNLMVFSGMAYGLSSFVSRGWICIR